MVRIGVDLGGTKIEAAVFDESGRELLRKRVPTPRSDYHDLLRALIDLVLALERAAGQTATVGIGMPGALSLETGLVKNANTVLLNGKPFADDVAQALARPIRVANDANCFALSEAIDGAGAGERLVFGVILGTGVGGGLVFEQGLWTGRNAIAGEWGHTEMPQRDENRLANLQCYCGRVNCVETYLSGPALAADHARRGGDSRLDAKGIAAAAAAGDGIAALTLETYCVRLGRALATVIDIVDPDIVVLGGGLSNIDALYSRLPAIVAGEVFSDSFTTPIVKNRHGDSSGVRGAAGLWSP